MGFFIWFFDTVLFLLFWAVVSGVISSFFVFIPEAVIEGKFFSGEHFLFSGFAGVMGIVFAAPLLISVFMPWLYICESGCGFWKLVSVPTIASALYVPFFMGASPASAGHWNKMGYMLAVDFPVTALLTSFFMWRSFYRHNKKSDAKAFKDNVVESSYKFGVYQVFCLLSLFVIVLDFFYLFGLSQKWWSYSSGCLDGFRFGQSMSGKCYSETFKIFHMIVSLPFFHFIDVYRVTEMILSHAAGMFVYFSAARSVFFLKSYFNIKLPINRSLYAKN